MISLMLQCCPVDYVAAMELTLLICDLEKEKRKETEFFLTYRKDTPLQVHKYFEAAAGAKFERALARPARNFDDGWPGGSNMLAFCAQMEVSILRREGLCKNDAFLLFEADCVPLSSTWLDELSAEWELTKSEGKEAFGHWNMPGGLQENLHMNGNCVLKTTFFDDHPTWIVGPATQGWDYFYRERFISISRDSYAIQQYYACPSISFEDLQKVEKHGRRPALLHGIKDGSARAGIRQTYLGHSLPI